MFYKNGERLVNLGGEFVSGFFLRVAEEMFGEKEQQNFVITPKKSENDHSQGRVSTPLSIITLQYAQLRLVK
jgi:hypothetical protein